MSAGHRIGFMQGRLSPPVDDKIQAFPREHWRDEFVAAQRLGIHVMEWTLDQDGLYENPLLSEPGRAEIVALSRRHGVRVSSLTGDCFMQAPFWKAEGARRDTLVRDFSAVLGACAALGIKCVVLPLVDNGRLSDDGQRQTLQDVLLGQRGFIVEHGLFIAFESDLPPTGLAAFIAAFPADSFGINYDLGNSASFGYDCGEEIAAYGDRIVNVHVKDRARGGTTVPLGAGSAELARALRLLSRHGYHGNYILQTARDAAGDHAGAIARYRNLTAAWLDEGD